MINVKDATSEYALCNICVSSNLDLKEITYASKYHPNMSTSIRICKGCVEELHSKLYPGSYVRNW